MLFGCFAQLAEVGDDFFVVKAGVDVKACPQVAKDNSTAETIVGQLGQGIAVDTAGGHHLAVNEAGARGIMQLLGCVAGVALGVGDAVEDGREEDIVHAPTVAKLV